MNINKQKILPDKFSTLAVIIPFYNGSKYWLELVESLSVQTSKLDEAVIVLDGEKQLLPDIKLDEIAHQVKVIKLHENKGVANARNVGLDSAVSDYIFFLDQDDYFLPKRVEMVRNLIYKQNPIWIVNTTYFVNKHREIVKIHEPANWLSSIDNKFRLTKQYTFAKGNARISAVCCRKDSIQKFNKNMGSSDDFVFLLQLINKSPALLIDEPGNARRFHDDNQWQSKKHRLSKLLAVSYVNELYAFEKQVRKKVISMLCVDIAVECLINKDLARARHYFRRAFTLYLFNLKAIIGYLLCALSNRPIYYYELFTNIRNSLRKIKL